MEEPAIDSPSDSTATDEPQSWVDEGRTHYRQGEYELALSCMNRAYERYVENDDSSPLAEIANDLGVVYTVLRQWNQAEKWIADAQTKFAEMGDYDGEAQTLGNMAACTAPAATYDRQRPIFNWRPTVFTWWETRNAGR